MNIRYLQFRSVVAENWRLIDKYLSTGRLRYVDNILFSDGNKFYELGIGSLHKIHDVIPAAILGLLPINKKTGPDAVEVLSNGKVVYHEIKMATIDTSLIRRTKRNSLFTISEQNAAETDFKLSDTTNLRSKIQAVYGKEVRNRRLINTTLLTCCRESNQPLFAFRLPANQMEKMFEDMPKSSTIKLNKFITYGTEIELPNTSFELFEKRMLKVAPLVERYR